MSHPLYTVSEVLESSARLLSDSGIEKSSLEAELIVAHTINISRLELFFHKKRLLTPSQSRKISRCIQHRTKHKPLQYIIGRAYFRNLCLAVGPGVLIPRMETELLVDIALSMAPHKAKILDIGTGSGAIALSMASERPDINVTAIDISSKALAYAQKNKRILKVKNVQLIKGNLLGAVKKQQKFNLIAANLPYVSSGSYKKLPCEIREYEPAAALIAGPDGLKFIKPLIENAHKFLLPDGTLILEISPEQRKMIAYLAKSTGKYRSIDFAKDLCGKIRFCILKYKALIFLTKNSSEKII